MKKYIALLCVCVCVGTRALAQFDPQLGQYMFAQSTFNPAAVGEGDMMRVLGDYRLQFTGISNAPMTTHATFTSPFAIGNTKHGAGVRFLDDRFGLFTNQSLYVQYAYRIPLGKGYLSVGVDLGFLNVSFRTDSVNLKDIGTFHTKDDPVLQGQGQAGGDKGLSGMGFDLGAGVYYAAPSWWAGISYAHIPQPKIELSTSATMAVKGTLYAAGGYNWRLANRDWVLRPSAMVMTDFGNWDANLTFLAQCKEKYRFGLGYRIAGSVNFIASIDVIDGLELGYTYELPANNLIRESYGSHEVYLAYGFNILKPKYTGKVKSVRYL